MPRERKPFFSQENVFVRKLLLRKADLVSRQSSVLIIEIAR